MTVVIYDVLGEAPKQIQYLHTLAECRDHILNNTQFEDSIFAVLDEDGTVIHRYLYDVWKEDCQFT